MPLTIAAIQWGWLTLPAMGILVLLFMVAEEVSLRHQERRDGLRAQRGSRQMER